MSYKHLSITERKLIAIYRAARNSLCQIAKLLGRHKSTISRELARNSGDYLPSKAQARYRRRRKESCLHKLLEKLELFALVKKLFLGSHLSPEQMTAHLKIENYPILISCKTIYRTIYAGMFDIPEQKRSTGNRGARRKLRHRGKPRHPRGYVFNRGKIPISHELSERPVESFERSKFGNWSANPIVDYNRKSGLLTLIDRKSRFLIYRKLKRLGSKEVKTAMIENLRGQPLHSITLDRNNASPTITPTTCCASTFQKVTTSTRSNTKICKRSSIN